MIKDINQHKMQLKIIAEDMAKLYEHTDKIEKENGETLVDIKFNITEEQVDSILIRSVRELLETWNIEYTNEELGEIVNDTKKEAAKRINKYRKEKGIKPFTSKEIER